MDVLDEPSRTAVLLRYQQGFSYEEMAAICHEKAGTLQARVSRALRRLREMMESRLGSEEDPRILQQTLRAGAEPDVIVHRAA